MHPTETAAPPGKTLELLNPAEIIPRNVRQQVDAKMVDSLRRRGQETPVGVLRTPGGQMFLRFGDRRRLACIAPYVICPIAPSMSTSSPDATPSAWITSTRI